VTVDGTRLLVGNADGSFPPVGSLSQYTLAGEFVTSVASGLMGNYAHAIDNDGNILITGVSADDSSSSTVIAVAPGGQITQRAAGFVFSTELFHDTARAETLVLDVFV